MIKLTFLFQEMPDGTIYVERDAAGVDTATQTECAAAWPIQKASIDALDQLMKEGGRGVCLHGNNLTEDHKAAFKAAIMR